MKSRHESKRDHTLRTPLEKAIAQTVDNEALVKKIVEEVLNALDEQNIISYTVKNNINMLTPFGRVLTLLIERPNLTVREMSVFLGVTEANIIKSVAKLNTEKLIIRKKKDGRFEYSVNPETVGSHSDIRRLFLLLARLISEK
jgi:Mn-dependent DtxR family transcriptional regulator